MLKYQRQEQKERSGNRVTYNASGRDHCLFVLGIGIEPMTIVGNALALETLRDLRFLLGFR